MLSELTLPVLRRAFATTGRKRKKSSAVRQLLIYRKNLATLLDEAVSLTCVSSASRAELTSVRRFARPSHIHRKASTATSPPLLLPRDPLHSNCAQCAATKASMAASDVVFAIAISAARGFTTRVDARGVDWEQRAGHRCSSAVDVVKVLLAVQSASRARKGELGHSFACSG